MNVSNSLWVNQQPTAASPASKEAETSFFGEIFDTLNPLQHIPVVSNIYRAITGDGISSFANIAGGALFGGPVGAGVAAASEIAKAALAEVTSEPGKNAFANNATVNQANNAYAKTMRVTTADWLNADFGKNAITV